MVWCISRYRRWSPSMRVLDLPLAPSFQGSWVSCPAQTSCSLHTVQICGLLSTTFAALSCLLVCSIEETTLVELFPFDCDSSRLPLFGPDHFPSILLAFFLLKWPFPFLVWNFFPFSNSLILTGDSWTYLGEQCGTLRFLLWLATPHFRWECCICALLHSWGLLPLEWFHLHSYFALFRCTWRTFCPGTLSTRLVVADVLGWVRSSSHVMFHLTNFWISSFNSVSSCLNLGLGLIQYS